MNPVHEFALHDTQPMTKEAAPFWKSPEFRSVATRGAITMATPFAMLGAFEGYDAIKGAIQKSRGFKKMVEANPELKNVPADRLKLMYNTVHSSSPSIAQDPLAAGSVVSRMAEYGGKVDTKTISELASAEQRMGKQMTPFRQQMVSNMSQAMAGGVMTPVDIAKMRDAEAGAALKGEELNQLGKKLEILESGQKLREQEYGLKEREFGQRRFEHEEKQDLGERGLKQRIETDRENIRVSRTNMNEQTRHNQVSEAISSGQLGVAKRQAQTSAGQFGLAQERMGLEYADRGITPEQIDVLRKERRLKGRAERSELIDRMKHFGAMPGQARGGYGSMGYGDAPTATFKPRPKPGP